MPMKKKPNDASNHSTQDSNNHFSTSNTNKCTRVAVAVLQYSLVSSSLSASSS